MPYSCYGPIPCLMTLWADSSWMLEQVHKGTWMGAPVATKIILLYQMAPDVKEMVVTGVEATTLVTIMHPNVSSLACGH